MEILILVVIVDNALSILQPMEIKDTIFIFSLLFCLQLKNKFFFIGIAKVHNQRILHNILFLLIHVFLFFSLLMASTYTGFL